MPHCAALHAGTPFATVQARAQRDVKFRQALLGVYVPRYGEQWEQFLDSGVQYARIDAERMFAFSMPPSKE